MSRNRQFYDVWELGRDLLRSKGWRQVELETLVGFVWERDGRVACLDFAMEYERGKWTYFDLIIQHDSLIERYGEIRDAYRRKHDETVPATDQGYPGREVEDDYCG